MHNGNFVESVLSPLQPILATVYARQIEKAHEQALIENKTRIRDWATIGKGKESWLTGISRGFGGDNAFYEVRGTPAQKITIAVGWALGGPYSTTVLIDDRLVAEFNDPEYIQPHIALARLGYVVHGTVDFTQAASLKKCKDITPVHSAPLKNYPAPAAASWECDYCGAPCEPPICDWCQEG